jgi:hypothetical protein
VDWEREHSAAREWTSLFAPEIIFTSGTRLEKIGLPSSNRLCRINYFCEVFARRCIIRASHETSRPFHENRKSKVWQISAQPNQSLAAEKFPPPVFEAKLNREKFR